MPTTRSPRKGSLQFWPRKRASKFLPSVNWDAIPNETDSAKNIKGFICYKAGMGSAYVKDNTPDSMTKGKNIAIPITIIECPPMKIFSVRFYNQGMLIKEIFAENLDKELKRKVKLPKYTKKKIEDIKEEYDDVKIICYSQPKKTSIKKTPDLSEIGLKGDKEEKINFIKEHLNKEISVSDAFEKGKLIDLRGLTKGKGFQGPVKRFGIGLKSHKSEKGRRKPGSLGPWHPARVTFRAPQAGQLGMFTRIVYNNKIIEMGKAENKFKNIKNFGDIKTDYIIILGSVQGPAKRALLAASPLRETKKQVKKNYDLIEIK
jgi:large subunit ribosomal protein L3